MYPIRVCVKPCMPLNHPKVVQPVSTTHFTSLPHFSEPGATRGRPLFLPLINIHKGDPIWHLGDTVDNFNVSWGRGLKVFDSLDPSDTPQKWCNIFAKSLRSLGKYWHFSISTLLLVTMCEIIKCENTNVITKDMKYMMILKEDQPKLNPHSPAN